MTRTATWLLLALGCAAPASAETWHGKIQCDILPGIIKIPLDQPFQLNVEGGLARYQRDIRIPDTAHPSGYRELGQGQVGPDGRLTLKGAGLSPGSSYTSEYSGTLPLGGRAASLTGFQYWHFDRHAPINRACTITLLRS